MTNTSQPAKVLPTNLDLERVVLGAMLEDTNFLRAGMDRGLTADDFTTETHRKIFETLSDLEAENSPIDAYSVAERLGCDDCVIATLGDCVIGAVLEFNHVMAHIKILQQKTQLRTLAQVGERLQAQALEVGADPELLTKSALSELAGIRVSL